MTRKVFLLAAGVAALFLAVAVVPVRDQRRASVPVIDRLLDRSARILTEVLVRSGPEGELPVAALAEALHDCGDCILLLIRNDGQSLYQSRRIYPERTNFLAMPDVHTAVRTGRGLSVDEIVWFTTRFERGGQTYFLRLGFTDLPWDETERILLESNLVPATLALVLALVLIVLFYLPYAKDLRLFQVTISGLDRERWNLSAHSFRTREILESIKTLSTFWQDCRERLEDLARKNLELETLLSGMTEGVMVVDEKLFLQRLNPAARRIFQITDRTMETPYLLEVTHSSALLSITENILWSGKTYQGDLTTAGGRKIRVVGTLVQGDNGKLYVLLVLDDITELQRLEEIRKDFVANVSHELKTPVTVIKGYIETILRTKVKKDERRRFLKIIRENANRMANIIEDLLTLSRLEREQSLQTTESFDLVRAIREAIGLYDHEARKKHIVIDFEPPEEETAVRGHQRLVVQALGNLLSNAVKYSEENTRVTVRQDIMDAWIVVSVVDQGIGIPQKDLERIFERFYRVDKGRSRDLGGTGLGLSIVKHIMQLHGGRVEVLSNLGQGSTFKLYFPR